MKKQNYILDAGIYIPTLANEIIKNQGSFHINFNGVAIGNGLLNIHLNDETLPQFFYSHGWINEEAWQEYQKTCCPKGLGETLEVIK